MTDSTLNPPHANEVICEFKRETVTCDAEQAAGLIIKYMVDGWSVTHTTLSGPDGMVKIVADGPEYNHRYFNEGVAITAEDAWDATTAPSVVDPFPLDGWPSPLVYFMRSGDRATIKIGTTKHMDKRIRQLVAEYGDEIRVLAIMEGGYELEGTLHGIYHHLRLSRKAEWFKAEKELAVLVASLAQSGKFSEIIRIANQSIEPDRGPLGKRLGRAFQRSGADVAQLAARLGISPDNVLRILAYHGDMKLQVAWALAVGMNIDPIRVDERLRSHTADELRSPEVIDQARKTIEATTTAIAIG